VYDTREEAQQKLGSTVVLLDDTPVYVTDASDGGENLALHYIRLRSGKAGETRIRDKGWEFRNLGPHIGYANYSITGGHCEALYLSRMGVRASHNTQGISNKNLRIPPTKGSPKLGISGGNISFNSFYSKPEFLDMLEQKYPSFKDVSKHFKSPNLISKAFNRQFAVKRPENYGDFLLQYRGRDIGKSSDLEKFRLLPEYSYLQETLEFLDMKVS
jgi:hypothetical protein